MDGSRRGNRASLSNERTSGDKITLRARRRGGGDRDDSTGTTYSETPTLASAPEMARKPRPLRGRAPARGRTPTKTRKKDPAFPRHVSDRRLHAPDPPGDDRSKLRSQSVNRSRRSRSQTRSRSVERLPVPDVSTSIRSRASIALADLAF